MSGSVFTIEKGISLPAGRMGQGGGPPSRYPFDQLEIGDSFFVPIGDRTHRQLLNTVHSCMRAAATRTGRKFSTRSRDGGLRCWRVA